MNKDNKEKQQKEKKKSIVIRLFEYAGNYKWFTIIGVILTAISSFTSILPIYYIWKVAKEVIESYPEFTNNSMIIGYAWLAVFYACLTMLLYLLGLLLCHLAAFRIAKNLRKKSIQHLMALPLGFFSANGSGKLRQVIDECAGSTETLLAHNVPDLVAAIISPIAIFGIMFWYDWRLGIVSIVPIVLSVLAMSSMFMSKGMRGKMDEKQEVQANMNNEAIEYVRGIPVVKTFGQTIFSFKKFHQAITRYNDFAAEIATKGKVPMVGFEVLINSVAIFLTLAGILFIAMENVMSEFLIIFLFGVFLMPLCTSVMYRIMFSSHNTILSENSLDRIELLLNQKTLDQPIKPLTPTDFDIEFESVDFTYPGSDKKALENLNLKIPQGSTYGLVGPSGGGKTTLATLIPRFFDVDQGSIKIGGIDVRNIENTFLMNNISFVFQQTSLYKMSILDNVRESKPNASKKEVLEALRLAQCMDFINELPNGIHTIYGTKGVYLSGGQAQRIAIARAILKDAPIILLDEATSFTDPENEFEIKKAFEQLTKGKTVLMIAHRLSSITSANKICYLDQGILKEVGTHQELLQKNGLYHELWDEYQQAFSWQSKGGIIND